MQKDLGENELKVIAEAIQEKIFVPVKGRRITVFLCGSDINDSSTSRARMAQIFHEYPRYEVLFPEDLFDDLLIGQGQHSLLSLENILAESVDAIVLFPESPGSFAELGAFSNNPNLARKMIVVSNKKYKKKKSFINYGPYRLVKASGSGKVMHVDYDDLSDTLKKHVIYRNINTKIIDIKKKHPVLRNVANILETENFILPCIYMIEDISNVSLYRLVEYATVQDQKLCEIATKSALGRLISLRYIRRTTIGYLVTQSGAVHVRDTFSPKYLDIIRIELLNFRNRRNTKVCYDRLS
jgi:hypothetical protein